MKPPISPYPSPIRSGLLWTMLGAALLLASCATQQGPLAGRVNGVPIPRDEYVAAHRGHFENFWLANERAPGIDEKNEIARQTWRNITKHVILQQHFRRYKITSSVSEAIDTLKVNPPSYILRSPIFQTYGKFDRALYQQSLLYGKPEDLSPLVRQYRDYYVPVAKLKEVLIEDQLLSASQKKLIGKAMSSRADIDLIRLDASKVDAAVREEEIKLYYEGNKESFKLEPRYSLAYAFMPLKASGADIAATNSFADSIFTRLTKGAPVDSLIVSMKSSAPLATWKESGFLKVDEIDPKLYSAFTLMKSGEYMPPVRQENGVAIHRLDQLTKSLISFSTLYLPYAPGKETIAADRPRAAQNARLLRGVGYQTAAVELDLAFDTKLDIKPGERWLDAGFVTPEAEQPANIQKGFVPEPVFNPARSAWLLIEVTDSRLERYMPLSEVRDRIYNELVEQNRRQFALKDAKDWLRSSDAANGNVSSLPQATKISLSSQSLERLDDPSLSSDILLDAMLRQLRKEAPQPYLKGDMVVIPLIRSMKSDPGMKVDPVRLREYFKSSLPGDWFNGWMEEQIRKAKVSIFIEL